MTAIRTLAGLSLAGLAACLAGCGPTEESYEVGPAREVERPEPPAPPGMTDEQRLRFVHAPEDDAGDEAPPERRWGYDTPEGWTELPPAAMRDLGWRVTDAPETECTFSVYEGKAGGLLANVNRWRQQMSLGATTLEALADLPRGRLVGQPAIVVDLEGTFVGMSGTRQEPGWRMLALVAELPMATAFLKLTGPAAAVAAERARFEALAASLRVERGGERPGARPGTSRPATSPPASSEVPFTWTVPEGWALAPARSMRLATFVPAGATATEVYVSQFSGTVGGVRANVDRWRGEMGLPAIGDADLAALPTLPVLGGTGVLLALDGSFAGMSGKPLSGARLLGLILPRSRDAVFVKMVGPAEEVRREEERFRAFCASLRE